MPRAGERLTEVQAKILAAMNVRGCAKFTGVDARLLGFSISPAPSGGIIVCVFGCPERVLLKRGLIERLSRDIVGDWFQITDKGRDALSYNAAKQLARSHGTPFLERRVFLESTAGAKL